MKIYVVGAAHNRFLPMENGRRKFVINEPHEGDNIDHLNPWYCELTGLYYLWKHETDDIVGLEHYRRYLVNGTGNLLNENEVNFMLSNHDIICTMAKYNRIRPVKSWLIQNRKIQQFEKFLMFVKVYAGDEFFNLCWDHLNGTWHCLGNMFIAKRELLNEYCEFMFPLLEMYRQAEEFYGRGLPNRICGYFTEFLFGAWLTWKHKSICWTGLKLIK